MTTCACPVYEYPNDFLSCGSYIEHFKDICAIDVLQLLLLIIINIIICFTEHDYCESTPCQHRQSCINLNSGYKCSCGIDYFGDKCESEFYYY